MTNNTIHTNTGSYGVNDAPAVGPLMQGQAGVVMTFTLTDLGGSVVNLTGLTITGTITNTQTKATAALQGAIALVTPASGVFSWTTHEDDVGTAGEFLLTFKSGTSLITLPAYLSILETPAASTTFGAALVGVTMAEAAWLTAQVAGGTDLADYLPLAGGTLTGNIVMSGSETVDGVDVSALASTVSGHVSSTSNPHSVTAAQIDALPEDAGITSKVTTYQLAAGDEGKIIECNGTFTVTLPDGLDTGFQAVIVNIGSGTITLAAATTLTSKDAATDLANQYGAATVYHAGANVWRAFGDLS